MPKLSLLFLPPPLPPWMIRDAPRPCAQALGEDTYKYAELMQRVVDREETVFEVELDDVLSVRLAHKHGVFASRSRGKQHMLERYGKEKSQSSSIHGQF